MAEQKNRDRMDNLDRISERAFQRGKNHLLLIGIDEYQYVGRLNNAVRDAQAFEQVLLNKYQFDPKHVRRLFNQDATRPGIAAALGLRMGEDLSEVRPDPQKGKFSQQIWVLRVCPIPRK